MFSKRVIAVAKVAALPQLMKTAGSRRCFFIDFSLPSVGSLLCIDGEAKIIILHFFFRTTDAQPGKKKLFTSLASVLNESRA